jgi:CRP/FNR family transcriptional regulator, polysaccharide utilization system transcription regulator
MKRKAEHSCENCGKAFESFFCQLKKDELSILSECKQVRFFNSREIIFTEGNKAQGLFCIREGKVKIYKNGSDGTEHITRVAVQGELMGIKALLSGHLYSVSAATLENSIICFIPKNDFFQLTIKTPEFTQSLVLYLSSLLEDAEAKMLSLAHKQVKQRLAETILFLIHSFNPGSFPNSKLYLNLTRNDLANIIGTSAETVIRILSEFKDQGIVAVKGRKIFILDPLQLNRIARQTT